MELQLTAAQASAVTGLSLKAINKAIDRGAIPSTAKAKDGVRKRYVSELALVCLKLEAKGLGELLSLATWLGPFRRFVLAHLWDVEG